MTLPGHINAQAARALAIAAPLLDLPANPVPGTRSQVLAVMPTICPAAPPGAEAPTAQLLGNVAWVVIMLFGLAVMISIGMVIAGRSFKIPGLTISGVIGLVVVALAAIGWFVAPEMIGAILGDGCT